MSSVSRYFLMSPCMLSLHLFLGRPRLLLPETSSLSDFAQMWLGSGQTTLVFCFPGKFQHVLRGPPSWCLHFWCGPTWSSLLPISTSSFRLNLVCSHLSSLRPNILNRMSSLVWWLFWRLCLSVPIAHHTGHFLPLHPSDSYPIVDISLWTSLTREQWPEVFEGCHCWEFSINKLYCGFCVICGARQVFCLCSGCLTTIIVTLNMIDL